MNVERISVVIGLIVSLLLCPDINASSNCFVVHSPPPEPVSLTPIEDYIRELEVEYHGTENIPYIAHVSYIQVAPAYPSNAIEQGLEGWCVATFDITESGQTSNLKIKQCSLPGVFEEVSLKAMSHFLYRPAIRNGEPVKSYRQEYQFTFELDNVSVSEDCGQQPNKSLNTDTGSAGAG